MTRISIGHAASTDAFQAGRESAEAAKRSLSDGPLDLVLALGPNTPSFKDFIEGVRLVAGEASLIGIPLHWVRSTETEATACVVAMQGAAQRVSVVSALERDNDLRGVTSVLTELRRRRGSGRLEYSYHGVMAFDAGLNVDRRHFAHLLASELGLESWLAGFSLWPQSGIPVVCGPRSFANGIAAIECLTEESWGLGWVDTSAFPPGKSVRREATKSALREALGQLGTRKPAAVFLFFATAEKAADAASSTDAIQAAAATMKSVPVIGMPVRAPYLRVRSGIVTVASEAVVALVIPE